MTANFKTGSLYYERYGEGEPLVLLHGFLESSKMWKPLLKKLSSLYKVFVIDLPGHGQTDTFSSTHSMMFMAKAVLAVCNKENIKDATLIGHSMGGYVALAFAEQFPEFIKGLVLINSTPAEDSITRKQNRLRAITLIKKYPDAFISMGITNLFAQETSEYYLGAINEMKADARCFSVDGIIANIKGMKERPKRVETLKNYSGKKLIIAGKKDPIIAIEDLRKLAKCTHTELKEVDGGHMSHLEATNDVTNALVSFINT